MIQSDYYKVRNFKSVLGFYKNVGNVDIFASYFKKSMTVVNSPDNKSIYCIILKSGTNLNFKL